MLFYLLSVGSVIVSVSDSLFMLFSCADSAKFAARELTSAGESQVISPTQFTVSDSCGLFFFANIFLHRAVILKP